MKKKTIFAIVGPSGSGKSTLVARLEETLGLRQLVSYTTRPMRNGEKEGREHWFTDVSRMPARTGMLAYALFGGFHYWAATEQVERLGVCTYIIDEDALVEMIRNYGSRYDIIPVHVVRDYDSSIDAERIARDARRLRLPADFYRLVIRNDGTLEEFLEAGEKAFREAFRDVFASYGLPSGAPVGGLRKEDRKEAESKTI